MANEVPGETITVVGGVYQEWCMRPTWQEIYGSAGRAASAIANMGAPVELHSYLDHNAKKVMEDRGAFEGYEVRATPIDCSITFEYCHGLATPRIYNDAQRNSSLVVRAERILRFGMMEGDAVVHGDRVVFDPQDANSPQAFAANGSTARELAMVLNTREAALLTGMFGAPAERMAEELIRKGTAQVVIIKQGPMGALVNDGRSSQLIPAYRSSSVWKLGSGDNFGAHFAYRWLYEGRQAAESADLASQATAYYCQTRGFATPEALRTFHTTQVVPSSAYGAGRKPTVYLAGPFFTLAQLWIVNQVHADLMRLGLHVFSPFHDVGHGSAEDVVMLDIAGIDAADLIFAIADGMDSGTIFEVGYARAKGKPVVVYSENESDENMKMMLGSACILHTDYVSAIYETLWTACSL